MFASYCAVEQHYTDTYSLSDILTAEGGDCGIDAVAIIVNGTLVTSEEEIDDLIELNKQLSDISFVFIQAKTSSSFNYGDIGTFGTGVKDFFSDHPQMVRNELIEQKSKLAEYIFSKATYMKIKPICYLYYITTGKWVNDQNCNARIEIARKDLLEMSLFEEVKIIAVDANLLQKLYRNTIDVTEATINQIIKATNRQTEVTDEQLIALNEFHRRLEAFYASYSGARRLYYERRSKQYSLKLHY